MKSVEQDGLNGYRDLKRVGGILDGILLDAEILAMVRTECLERSCLRFGDGPREEGVADFCRFLLGEMDSMRADKNG